MTHPLLSALIVAFVVVGFGMIILEHYRLLKHDRERWEDYE